MCKRHCQRLIGLLTFQVFVIFLLAVDISAQGGDGRSDSAKTVASGVRPRKRPIRRAPKRIPKPVPAIAAIETGRLALLVNEGGSEVILSSSDGQGESIAFSPKASSLYLRAIPAGSYNLQVRKAGYFDETRVVDIATGKRRKVVVSLRPRMAVLSVNTNVPDAEIEIESVGKFAPPIRKYLIKPGIYRVNVQRRGFLSQRIVVDLKIAGKEQNINVVLQPLRIDEMLTEASTKINRGNLEGAAALTNDVLLLNASHAKANLLFGMIEFKRGNVSAVRFFLRAVAGGETASLPFKLLEETGVSRLVEVEIGVNRDGISVKSSSRFDLNFRIPASDIVELQRQLDAGSNPFVVFRGKSDFHGRAIEPSLKIYSALSSLRADPKSVYCPPHAAGRSCSTDIDIIYKLFADWRTTSDALRSAN